MAETVISSTFEIVVAREYVARCGACGTDGEPLVLLQSTEREEVHRTAREHVEAHRAQARLPLKDVKFLGVSIDPEEPPGTSIELVDGAEHEPPDGPSDVVASAIEVPA